jgi:quercetin dioxygenase-like cupin family protein
MKTMTPPPIADLKTGDLFDLAGTRNQVLATGTETAGALFAFRCSVPPGGGPPPHTHTLEDEGFVVVEGEIELWVSGRKRVLRPGEFAFAPRDEPHRFFNGTTRQAQLMIFVYPASSARFFSESCRLVADPASAVYPPTPEHIQNMVEIGSQHGIDFLPPA